MDICRQTTVDGALVVLRADQHEPALALGTKYARENNSKRLSTDTGRHAVSSTWHVYLLRDQATVLNSAWNLPPTQLCASRRQRHKEVGRHENRKADDHEDEACRRERRSFAHYVTMHPCASKLKSEASSSFECAVGEEDTA